MRVCYDTHEMLHNQNYTDDSDTAKRYCTCVQVCVSNFNRSSQRTTDDLIYYPARIRNTLQCFTDDEIRNLMEQRDTNRCRWLQMGSLRLPHSSRGKPSVIYIAVKHLTTASSTARIYNTHTHTHTHTQQSNI